MPRSPLSPLPFENECHSLAVTFEKNAERVQLLPVEYHLSDTRIASLNIISDATLWRDRETWTLLVVDSGSGGAYASGPLGQHSAERSST